MFDRVAITSCDLFDRVRGAKIAANASSVTALGKFIVRDIGLCREKNADAAISAIYMLEPCLCKFRSIQTHDLAQYDWY